MYVYIALNTYIQVCARGNSCLRKLQRNYTPCFCMKSHLHAYMCTYIHSVCISLRNYLAVAYTDIAGFQWRGSLRYPWLGLRLMVLLWQCGSPTRGSLLTLCRTLCFQHGVWRLWRSGTGSRCLDCHIYSALHRYA